MSNLSRRRFLLTAAGSAAGAVWLAACGGNKTQTDSSNRPSPHRRRRAPEVKGATLGFIALTDSAPLIIALEKGLFAKHGMPEVKVMKPGVCPLREPRGGAADGDSLAVGAAHPGGVDAVDGVGGLRGQPPSTPPKVRGLEECHGPRHQSQ
nr:ABC transporter substrate-binding protein [Synechococcus sp. GFB01]